MSYIKPICNNYNFYIIKIKLIIIIKILFKMTEKNNAEEKIEDKYGFVQFGKNF
jgi:hypothetical protein